MNRLDEIDKQQSEILSSISKIRTMIQGTINETPSIYTRKDGTKSKGAMHYILTRKDERGKTVTRGIGKKDIDRYRIQAENHNRFKKLVATYVELSEERFKLLPFAADEIADAKKTRNRNRERNGDRDIP